MLNILFRTCLTNLIPPPIIRRMQRYIQEFERLIGRENLNSAKGEKNYNS